MAITLNPKGTSSAKALIKDGKVDKDSSWAISADDENAILGKDDWAEYVKWFLGLDDQESVETKAHYRYPMGKGGKIYRSALIAIRQRAGQEDAAGIFDAAGELIDLIDGDEEESDGKNGATFNSSRIKAAAQPWALMPECIAAIANPFAIRGEAQARPVLSRPAGSATGAIAVISLSGVISQHPDWFSDTSLDQFSADLMGAVNDPGVGAILISIDSPGGSVYGVAEAADLILAAREKKPIVALANSLAASAAYWLGCCASQLYCTPSGEVGSIGVWQAHMDFSGAMADAGIAVTLISAGKFKTEGNPYQPLDEDAQDFMQSRVDDYYADFTGAVAAARNTDVQTVINGMGQGRVLGASAAKKAGMIDGVMTFAQVVASMQKTMTGNQSAKKANKSQAAKNSLLLLG
jgi:signal peptide peptidase SppA